MRLGNERFDLTYCTNIHPGEDWSAVRAILDADVPAVRRSLGVEGPFGVGLRLSAGAAATLSEHQARLDLQETLARNQLYVATINGFPYGAFHGQRVKEQVYNPDWRDHARVAYTDRLADILARLLSARGDAVGSISTLPGAFKPAVEGDCARATALIAVNLSRHAARLVEIERTTGTRIVTALEPEPCCLLETIAETVDFFENVLFAKANVMSFAAMVGLSRNKAEAALRRHLGVCLDACHLAVEYEDPEAGVDLLTRAALAIPKVQLSAGLRIQPVTRDLRRRLSVFDDSVYLHQVVERGPEGLRRFIDLPHAFEAFDREGSETREEWRIHFHVPIFMEDLAPLASTRAFLEAFLARLLREPMSFCLEVETYTWSVLPEEFRREPLPVAIARELAWAMERISR